MCHGRGAGVETASAGSHRARAHHEEDAAEGGEVVQAAPEAEETHDGVEQPVGLLAFGWRREATDLREEAGRPARHEREGPGCRVARRVVAADEELVVEDLLGRVQDQDHRRG